MMNRTIAMLAAVSLGLVVGGCGPRTGEALDTSTSGGDASHLGTDEGAVSNVGGGPPVESASTPTAEQLPGG
jgi:hypothetical protein